MTLVNVLTAFYLLCIAVCGWPSIYRIVKRGKSADLSVWQYVILLVAVTAQFTVMLLTGANWRVWLSPINTGISALTTLVLIVRYR